MLTLRNPLDVAPTATNGVRMANLLAAPDAPVEIKRVEGRRVVKAPPARAPRLPPRRRFTPSRPFVAPSGPRSQ